MENVKIVTKLDFKTLKYCNLFILKYQRKSYIMYLVLAAISLGLVFADIFHFKTIYLGVLSGLYIVYLVYQIFTIEAKLDQNLTRYFAHRPVTTQTLEIADDKIILYRGKEMDDPIDLDWSFVTQILEMPQYYMFMAGRTPIIVDRSEDAVLEGSQSTLTAIVNEKAQGKPYKKVDFNIVKKPITFVHPVFPPNDVVDVESEVTDFSENENEAYSSAEEDNTVDVRNEALFSDEKNDAGMPVKHDDEQSENGRE